MERTHHGGEAGQGQSYQRVTSVHEFHSDAGVGAMERSYHTGKAVEGQGSKDSTEGDECHACSGV